jgi:hypothetical protein
MLLWQLRKAAIRPGAVIESHFRYQRRLKGQRLRDIRDYYSAMELGGPNSLHYRPVWTFSEAFGGKRKQLRSIAVFGFNADPVEGLKAASLTGCSHNSPFDGVSKADFDTC